MVSVTSVPDGVSLGGVMVRVALAYCPVVNGTLAWNKETCFNLKFRFWSLNVGWTPVALAKVETQWRLLVVKSWIQPLVRQEHLFYTLPFGECHREFSVIPGVDGTWPASALRHHAEGNAQHLSRLHAAVHHCLGKHMHFIHFMSFFVYCHRIWLLYMLQLLTFLSKVTYNNYICQKKIN